MSSYPRRQDRRSNAVFEITDMLASRLTACPSGRVFWQAKRGALPTRLNERTYNGKLCFHAFNDGNLAHQFGNWFPVLNDTRGAAVEVFDKDVGRIDAQVMVDRCQKITGAADAFDGVFAAFIGGSDKASGFDAAAGPDV